jgi:hypothetical protein
MTTLDPSYSLSPSETIFLNADQFVKTAMLGYRPVGSETKFSVQDLARTVIAGALLAMEAVGEIGLEVEEYKRLIGKGHRVKITPIRETSSFPIPSLEAIVLEICAYLHNSKKGATAKDMVWASLGKDDDQPWNKMVDSIPPHLAERGLLGSTEEKKLKIFTVTHYEMLDETRKLAQEGPVDALKALLSACEAERPDLWKRLNKEISQGINARDSSDDDDFD